MMFVRTQSPTLNYGTAIAALRAGATIEDVRDEVDAAGETAFMSYEECDIDEPEPYCPLAEELWDVVDTMERALFEAVRAALATLVEIFLHAPADDPCPVPGRIDEITTPYCHQVVHDLIAAPSAPPLALAGM